jgi:hypothetical protein
VHKTNQVQCAFNGNSSKQILSAQANHTHLLFFHQSVIDSFMMFWSLLSQLGWLVRSCGVAAANSSQQYSSGVLPLNTHSFIMFWSLLLPAGLTCEKL